MTDQVHKDKRSVYGEATFESPLVTVRLPTLFFYIKSAMYPKINSLFS